MAENKSNFGKVVTSLLEGLEGFASARTVVGDPINVGEAIVIPLVDVSIGVGAGAALNAERKKDREAGGMGAKLSPTALLYIKDGSARIINIKDQTTAMKIIDMIPDVYDRLTGKTGISGDEASIIKKAVEAIKK